jgi:Glu-tRNA(Gln) amidotransferase subunit E-like FAD-binding protein
MEPRGLNMDLDPKTALENVVKMMLFQQLQGSSEELMKRLVTEALTKREQWSNRSLLEDVLQSEVRQIVASIVREAVETRREQITEEVKAKLDAKFFETVVEKLSAGLASNLEISFKVAY